MGEKEETRRRRQSRVLKMLRTEPLSIREIWTNLPKALKPSRRTVEKDIEDFQALGLIESKNGKHYYGRRIFTPEEHELALKHSVSLLFTREEDDFYGFDSIGVAGMLNLLCVKEDIQNGVDAGPECDYILQHLRTGYNAEIWVNLEQYCAYLRQYGLEYCLKTTGIYEISGLEKLSDDERERFETLERELTDQLYHLKIQVESGTPLKGVCDICPKEELIIKGEDDPRFLK